MANVKANAQDYINKLYDQNQDRQKQLLMEAFSKGTESLDTAKQDVQKQTDVNLERTDVEAQRAQQAYKPQNVSYAIGQQSALSMENQQKKNTQMIRDQQQTAEAELERVRKVYADQYAAAIKKAQADNDMARAQQLYEAAKAKDAELSGFYSSVGTLDNEALINQIYASANESEKQALQMSLAEKLSGIYAQREAQQKETDKALTQTYVDDLKRQKNFAEVQNAYGLGSGNMAQAQLAQNTDATENLAELRRVQMIRDAALAQQRAETEKTVADAAAEIGMSNEQKRLEALYREAQTRQVPATTQPAQTSGGTYGEISYDPNRILEVQKMLNQQGANLSENGVFDDATRQAYAHYVSDNMKENYSLGNSYNDERIRIEGATGREGITFTELEELVRADKVKEVVDPVRKTVTYVAVEQPKGKSTGGKNLASNRTNMMI